jgi:hypothetical protein
MNEAVSIFDRLVLQAKAMTVGCPGDRIKRARQQRLVGIEPIITEDMRPGYLLMFISDEDREKLKRLTSRDIEKTRTDAV